MFNLKYIDEYVNYNWYELSEGQFGNVNYI